MGALRTNVVVWLLVTLTIGFLTGCSSPTSRLNGHVEKLTEIMEDKMDEPEEGVEEIHEYLQSNLPAIFEDFGTLLVEIDECDSNSDRQDLIESWVDDVEESIIDFMEVAEEFGEAVEDDDDAEELLEEIAERYGDLEDVLEDVVQEALFGR